ncbi:MAG TPA: hypothetical protein VKP88_07060, partial [Candidatus Paceibacterota bacterium]|nr:hypothetical protein [Candidatus Paceibacterota bacterium]
THTMLDFFFNMYAESVQAIELRVLHAALCHALDKRRLLHAEILAQQWCCSDSHPVLRVQITRPVPKFYADVMARYNVQIDTLPGLLLDE